MFFQVAYTVLINFRAGLGDTALYRNLLKEDLGEFLRIGFAKAELAEERCLDHARADCVDADVPVDQLGS